MCHLNRKICERNHTDFSVCTAALHKMQWSIVLEKCHINDTVGKQILMQYLLSEIPAMDFWKVGGWLLWSHTNFCRFLDLCVTQNPFSNLSCRNSYHVNKEILMKRETKYHCDNNNFVKYFYKSCYFSIIIICIVGAQVVHFFLSVFTNVYLFKQTAREKQGLTFWQQ